MGTIYQRGQTPTFMARITNSERNRGNRYSLLSPEEVTGIQYSILKMASPDGGGTPYAVTGHIDQAIPLSALLEELETNDPNWTPDRDGYNFKFSPDSRVHPAFPEAGNYRVTFKIIPTEGNPIVWSRSLRFV